MKTPSTRSKWTATHYGECQLCGHTQKLPGGGLLSLHGYEVRWNSFQGTCPGSRNLPYEKAYNLLGAEIERQRHTIASLQKWVREISAKSFKNVFVHEDMKLDGKRLSVERELTPSEYKVVETKYSDWSSFKLEWMTKERGTANPSKKDEAGQYEHAKSAAELITKLNAAKVREINANIKNREDYCAWLQDRITNWKLKELRPIPVEEQGSKGVTLHAINEYWSKKTGKTTALCGDGSRSMRGYTYKATTPDHAKVTCKACLKALASMKAEAAISEQANALIAEMVAKYGDDVRRSFTTASNAAVKELRYQRKDIDKAVRKLACDRIDRGLDRGVKS